MTPAVVREAHPEGVGNQEFVQESGSPVIKKMLGERMTIGLQKTMRLGVVVIGALLLAGCASSDSARAKSSISRAEVISQQMQREKTLNTAWQGKPYDALLQQFGEPPLLMNVIGERPLRTSLVVYTKSANEARCIDAFTMVKLEASGQWVVADYFCR